MFKFEHPQYLFGLIGVVCLALAYYRIKRNRLSTLRRLSENGLWASLIPNYNETTLTRRSIVWLIGMTLLVISLSNPQWGLRKEKVEIKSTDVFIALDVSNSMLSDDLKPNRLERSKLWAESLVRSLAGDRIGIVLFAGHAFLQSPLTTDYGSATMFIRAAHPDMITRQGTNISDALITCLDNFSKEDEAQKVILLISDGEDHDLHAMESAGKAKGKNAVIYSIGAGTPEGGLIPVQINNLADYKRDETGKPVQTKLNKPFLTALAQSTSGKYYSMENGEPIILSIKADIANMTKQRIAERAYTEYESYFHYFLFLALILLVTEYLMSIKWIGFQTLNIFNKSI